MENYDKALELENSALNSNGQAMEKYQIYQDSIAAKQERINALAQTWVQNMNFEYIISGLLSIGEVFMKVFSNQVVVNIGKAVAALLVFNKALTATQLLVKMFTEMKGLYSTGALIKDIIGAAGLDTLLPIIAAVTVAVVALIAIIDKFHKSAKELQQDLSGLESEISSSKSTLEQYADQIETNNEKITELQKLISKGTGGLVEQSEIDKLKEENKELQTNIELEERRLELMQQEQQETAEKLYSEGFKVQRRAFLDDGYGNKILSDWTETVAPEDVIAEYQEEIAFLKETYQDLMDEGRLDEANAYRSLATETETKLVNEVIPVLQTMAEIVDAEGNLLYPQLNAQIEKYLASTRTVGENIENLANKNAEGYAGLVSLVEENSDEFQAYIEGDGEALNDLADELYGNTSPQVRDFVQACYELGIPLKELARYLLNAKDSAQQLGISLETPASQITKFKDKVSAVVAAEEELNETGYVSADVAEDLAEAFGDDVYDAMTWSAKGYKISREALEDLIKKQEESYVLALTKAQNAANAVVGANLEETASYKEKTVAILEAIKAKKREYFFGSGLRALPEWWGELTGIEEDLENAQKNLDNFYKTIEYLRNTTKTTKTTSTKNEETAYEKTIRNLEHQIYLSQQLSDIYKDTDATKYQQEIERQTELYTQMMDKVHEEAQRLRALGYAETSEEIEDLQQAWWGYYNSRSEMQKSLADDESEYDRTIRILEHQLYLSEQMSNIYEDTDADKYRKEIEKQAEFYKQLMEQVYAQAQKLRAQGYADTSEEIQALQKAWWGYYNSLLEMQKSFAEWEKGDEDEETAYERAIRILEHKAYLSEQMADVYKDTDEERYKQEVENQVDYYTQLMDEVQAEAIRLRKEGYAATSEEIQDLERAWWGYYNSRRDLQEGLSDWEKQNAEDTAQAVEDALSDVKDAINDLFDEAEDELNDRLEELDVKIKKNEAIKTLHETFFGVLNDVADGMHEISKELETSMRSADYLDESLRKTMFNESDYVELSDKLNEIATESEKLFKNYLAELEGLSEDEIYKAEYITGEFERQYNYKALEYDVAEKELALVKAQTKLQNTLMNRNVRMYKNGQWIWTADYSAVEEAEQEKRDAEYEHKNAEIKLKQQEVIDKYDIIVDTLEEQKITMQNQFDALRSLWEDVQKQLTTEEDAMTRLLKAINGTDIPEFRKILSNASGSLDIIISGVSDFDGSLSDVIASIDKTSDKMADAIDDSVVFINDSMSKFSNGVNSAVGTLKSGIESAVSSIIKSVSALSGVSIETPKYYSGTTTGGTTTGGTTTGGTTSGTLSSDWTLADGSAANLNYKDTAATITGTKSAVKGADMSRDTKWAGQTVQKNGYAITYDNLGYAVSAVSVRVGSAREDLANVYPHVDADGNLMYKAGVTDNPRTGTSFYYDGLLDNTSSSSSSKTSSSSSSSSSSSKTSSSSSSSSSTDTRSNQKKYLDNLVSSGTAGQKAWAKDQISKGLYDTGGVLEGTGGIKATEKDETVFGPELSSKILSPQKSKEFLNSANALTKMLDNSAAFSSILNRFAGIVGGNSAVSNDSHDIYLNGNPLRNMTKSDSLALTTILRRYIPITGGGR